MTIVRQIHTVGYIYIKKQSIAHAHAVTALTGGFEGQLLGWWMHTLSLAARVNIINHTKTISVPSTSTNPGTFLTTTINTTFQPDGIDVLSRFCQAGLQQFLDRHSYSCSVS